MTKRQVVGTYDVPDTVPEWTWIENSACFGHTHNGTAGIWESVIHTASRLESIPANLKPVIEEARSKGLAYLIFHQGT